MESTAAPVPLDQLLAHRAWLRRLARALVGDPQAADDLTQEVWLAAIRRPPRTRRSLRGWLATVLRRKALDHRRASERRARREAGGPPPRRAASAQALIAQTETHRRVTEAVLALEEPYRSALVLRYVGDHSVAEVARLLDAPVETVRTRLKRGIAKLRQGLDAEHAGRRAWTSLLAPLARPERMLGTSAATVTGGVIVSSKLATVAAALLVVALATWASFELASDDLADGTSSDVAEGPVGPGVGDLPAAEPKLEGRGETAREVASPVPATEVPRRAADPRGYRGPSAAPGRIAGRVLGPDGNPVQGVTIVVDRLGAGDEQAAAEGFPKYWGAGPSGWFRLDGLPMEGAYSLRVYAPGFAERNLETRAGHAPLAIWLAEGLALAGRLVTDDPRVVLAGIPLLARHESSPVVGRAFQAETDAQGRFVFDGLSPGGHLITFGARNRAKEDPAALFVPIRFGPAAAGRDDLEIPVVLGDVIAGRLVREDGSPVKVTVRVEALGLTDEDQKDYARQHNAASTAQATFELRGLSPGRYALSFEPAAPEGEAVLRGPRTTYVHAVASGTTDLEVTLLEGLAVHGRLVDAAGEPVRGEGYVQVRPAGSVPGGQDAVVLRVDATGRFHTAPLDPGLVYVVAVSSFTGHMPKTVEGVIPSEEGIVVRLAPAGRITGRVVDTNGAPAAGTGVRAYAVKQPVDAEGRNAFAYVDHNGRFELEGLGEFEFRVHAGGASSGFVPAEEARVLKPGATDVVLRVKMGVPLAGRLVDDQDRPIQSPYVAVTNGAVVWFTQVSDEEGHFRLPGVPAGKLTLSAQIDGRPVPLGEVRAPAEDLTIRVPPR